eukprot:Blabericola_migrator_1__6144@NODE_30_length_19081_cov_136_854686_g26_i0_p9_GENE_NODE_30_length_19081_cov_136_854686_g26_i0NODE_30_length_19081_cov_136_854686_g26_i0_p9_ORF_typecomplete_len284_score22_00_NODE_30_length_19081_cov_136_854686_g26_i01344214293
MWTILLSFTRIAHAIPILGNAKVVLDCATASGAISCDWLCYDTCLSSATPYLTVDQVESCVAQIKKSCVIPAIAYNTIILSDYCSIDGAAEDDDEESVVEQFAQPKTYGYIFTLPKIGNQQWEWAADSSRIHTASVDVDGDFDIDYCLAPAHYTIGPTNTEVIVDPETSLCVSPTSNTETRDDNTRQSESDTVYDTTSAFGFQKLNLNFTIWAQDYELDNNYLGAAPMNLQLSSVNPCWAKATNMTMFYSVNFDIHTDEFDGATHMYMFPVLGYLMYLICVDM